MLKSIFLSTIEMYLEICLLIGLHGNQQSMFLNLSLPVLHLLFSLVLFLVSISFWCVSYIAYRNLLVTKAFDVVV
jgi:hypothetical protein